MAAPRISISITESAPDIANNTTTLTAKLNYYGNGESWNANTSCAITLNGSTKTFTANIGKNTSGVIGTHSVTVKHNDDGRKTVSYSAYAAVSDFYGTTRTSGTYTCTTIPRVSDLTLSASSIIADGTSKVTATAMKKSSSFTDVITVALGDYSMNVTSGNAFSVPTDWCNAITNDVSAIATVTVTTKSGNTVIGSKTANLVIKVPDNIKPAVTSIQISEANTSVTTKFGQRYVKNLSKLNIRVNGSGAYGSDVNDAEVLVAGIKYLGLAIQTDYIKSSGTVEIVAVIRDSRGRTATMSKTITVVDYEVPVITNVTYANCNADGSPNSSGSNIKLTISGKVFSVAANNTKNLRVSYGVPGGTQSAQNVAISDWDFKVDTILSGTDPTKTYLIKVELTDKVGTAEFTLSTGKPVISRLAGGGGVTLFKEAEKEGFWVGNIDYTMTDAEYQTLLDLLGGGV